jgi:drug/metabolite transporter (DMT)-like permease
MLWLLFLILSIVVWGSYDVFFKVTGQKNPFLALLFIAVFQVIVALPLVLYFRNEYGTSAPAKEYALWALMGVLLALGTVFFFYTFKYGANASIAIPAYGIGTLLIGTVAGLLFFKEPFSPQLGAGLALGVVSIILLTFK